MKVATALTSVGSTGWARGNWERIESVNVICQPLLRRGIDEATGKELKAEAYQSIRVCTRYRKSGGNWERIERYFTVTQMEIAYSLEATGKELKGTRSSSPPLARLDPHLQRQLGKN